MPSTRKILVTGAAGFIGFHTAKRLLDEGYAVTGIDNLNDYYDPALKDARLSILKNHKAFTFHKANIADDAEMARIWAAEGGFLEVVHLAAQAGVRYSLENPLAYIDSNLRGHTVILELCRKQEGFAHLVYASSSSVYGRNEEQPFAVEHRTDRPASLYAATKKGCELLSDAYGHLFRFKQTGLRFFTVYGPWGRPDMSPIIFAKAIAEGAELPVFNEGDMKRDFTYIDDIVDGIIGALKRADDAEPHKVYNLGNNKSERLMDFIHEMENAMNGKARLKMLPMQKGDVVETSADIADSRRDLGFNPQTPITEGLPKFAAWFRDYYEHARITPRTTA
jgi:UDP-glucuronate 4-epimerase